MTQTRYGYGRADSHCWAYFPQCRLPYSSPRIPYHVDQVYQGIKEAHIDVDLCLVPFLNDIQLTSILISVSPVICVLAEGVV